MATKSSSFKDNLGALVDRHLAARESERMRVKDLRLLWEKKRQEVVTPIFDQVVEVLDCKALDCQAKWNRRNGCVVLESGDGEQSEVRHELRFGLDEQKGEAVCTSTFEALNERFSFDRLDATAVQSKVECFVEALFVGPQKERKPLFVL